MQSLIDNLSATVIGGTIFLMLVGVQARNQRASIEAANYYAVKQQQLTFIEVLKRDLQNITEVQSIEIDPGTGVFRFEAVTDPADMTARTVEYRRIVIGGEGDLTRYQIQRYVDGVMVGGSASTLTDWEIVARNAEGGAIVDTEDARQLVVSFSVAAPFKESETIRRARWEASFHPPLLRQDLTL